MATAFIGSSSEDVVRIDAQHLADRDVSREARDHEHHGKGHHEVVVGDDRGVIGHAELRESDERRAEADAQAVPSQPGMPAWKKIMATSSRPLAPMALSAPNFSMF